MEEIQYSLPGVAIRLYEMEPREALTALMNNQIDLAIVHDLFFDNTDKRLVAQQQLYTDRFYVILSRSTGMHPSARWRSRTSRTNYGRST